MSKPSSPPGFILETLLGKGAFSEVWLAKDISLNEYVAIKITSKNSLISSAETVRYQNEVSIHKEMKHPFIVPVFYATQNLLNYYIIMEYLPKGNLFDYIQMKGQLTESEYSHYFVQMCQALKYMHSHNICHHDMKLQNILLDNDNNIRICDFGFSERIDDPNSLTKNCGSLKYAAPEMLMETDDNKPHTIAIDIWALGVILFRMSCGYFPFNDEPVSKLRTQIIMEDLVFPNDINNDLKEILTKMLDKNPQTRININEIESTEFYKKALEKEPVFPLLFAGMSPHNRELQKKLSEREKSLSSPKTNRELLKLQRNKTLSKLIESGQLRPIEGKRPFLKSPVKTIKSETPPIYSSFSKESFDE